MVQHTRNGQEKLRGNIMEMVKRNIKTRKAASLELGIRYSRAKRMYQRYLTGGDDAPVHGNTGRPSNNKADEAAAARTVALYREQYTDCGPTPAQETLGERDGVEISVSTLRRAPVAAGRWKAKRNGSEYRSRRTPRSRFGEPVPFDGGHHDRFEGRGASCCLITMIDDFGLPVIVPFTAPHQTLGPPFIQPSACKGNSRFPPTKAGNPPG